MEQVDCVVIGAGVIGLAVARRLAQAGREVLVLEAADSFGTITSSRNSEVIHAGIYYPPGSLKARLCVAGRRALYAYLDDRGLPYKNCGKLIVATEDAQRAKLERLAETAAANDVEGLTPIDAADAMRLEPALQCVSALWSPVTGVFDSHAFMLALLGDVEDAGGMFVRSAPVERAAVMADGLLRIDVGGDAGMTLAARAVVNAAGLAAPAVAARFDGLPERCVPQPRFAKGQYFSHRGRAPFSRLIYPAPVDGGLGVHVTVDMGGAARLGPDVTWDTAPDDVSVDPARIDAFYEAARAYWPSLDRDRLQPDYAGVRPKLSGPGEPPADFRLDGPAVHGVDGLLNIFGLESPGLTASLAVADEAAARLFDWNTASAA